MKALILITMLLTSLSSFAGPRESVTEAHLDSICLSKGTALKMENDQNLRVDQLNAELGITPASNTTGK